MRIERKIMDHLTRKEPYCMSKRQLQQKMWRYGARFFNRVIDKLIREDWITYYQGFLYPYRRRDFMEVFNIPAGQLAHESPNGQNIQLTSGPEPK